MKRKTVLLFPPACREHEFDQPLRNVINSDVPVDLSKLGRTTQFEFSSESLKQDTFELIPLHMCFESFNFRAV